MADGNEMMSTKEALKHIFSFVKPLITLGVFIVGYKTIEKLSYEPGTEGIITKRKARRIRFLTKFKLRYLKKHRYIERLLWADGYYEHLNQKMNKKYGMQLCNTGTDRANN